MFEIFILALIHFSMCQMTSDYKIPEMTYLEWENIPGKNAVSWVMNRHFTDGRFYSCPEGIGLTVNKKFLSGL